MVTCLYIQEKSKKMKNRSVKLLILFLALACPAIVYAACTFPISLNDCAFSFVDPATGETKYQILFSILCRVQYALGGAVFQMYQAIETRVATPVKVFGTLYIIFFSGAYLMGLIKQEAKLSQFVIHIVKLTLVMMFATNHCFFFDYIYTLFMGGMNAIALMAFSGLPGTPPVLGAGSSPAEIIARSQIIGNIDVAFNSIISIQSIFAIIVLIIFFLLSPGGIIISVLLSAGTIYIFYAFVKLFITFAIAIISLTFAMIFTPVFMIFVLFEQTRDLFYNWLSLLFTYAMQPIIILFYLVLMGQIMDISFILKGLTCPSAADAAATDACLAAFRADACVGTPVVPDPNAIIVPYCWKVLPTFITFFQWSFFQIKPGMTFDTPVTFVIPGNPPQNVNMPAFAAITALCFCWLVAAFTAIEFCKIVPELAQRLGTTQALLKPPGIGNISPGVNPKTGEFDRLSIEGGNVIVPGFTAGYASTTSVNQWRDALLSKLGGAWPKIIKATDSGAARKGVSDMMDKLKK